MKKILALSPYEHNTLYPVFSHFLAYMAELGHDVTLMSPGIGDVFLSRGIKHKRTVQVRLPKVHHFTFLVSVLGRLLRDIAFRREMTTIIALGPLTSLLLLPLFFFKSKVRIVSYQPELHEDRLGVFLGIYRKISAHVDLFVDVDEARLSVRKSLFKMNFRQTFILPNYSTSLPSMLGPKDRMEGIHFVYGGALSKEHNIERFLQAFAKVRDKTMYIHLYPIIHLGQEDRLHSLKTQYNESLGVVWHTAKPQHLFLEEVRRYHVGICSYPWITHLPNGKISENLNSKFAAPAKIYDYLSAGLLVLTGHHPTLKGLNDRGLVHFFEYEDQNSIEERVRNIAVVLKSQPSCIKQREIVQQEYSIATFFKKLRGVLEQ